MPLAPGGTFAPDSRIVSAGTFTREIDNSSGIAQGVADIGAVIVAPFKQGPGFFPTLVTNTVTLQQTFGVPDGTLYGPYTAQQYLQQKGFVTVCRVGALTGYWQRFPFVIWAESGTWLRNPDAGWLNYQSSTVSTSGLYFVSQSIVGVTTSSGQYTGSVIFGNQPVTITLVGGAATALPNGNNTGSLILGQPYPQSGSVLYNGQTINGYISGVFAFTGSLNISTASATSASIVNQVLAQNLFTGKILNVQFTSSQEPFTLAYNPYFIDNGNNFVLEVTQSAGVCGATTLNLGGALSGSFSFYNGNFRSGSNFYFDQCTSQWNGSGPVYKVLAVMADTQFGGINNQLQAPGFSGSILSYSSPIISASVFPGDAFLLALSQSSDGAYGTYNFSLSTTSPQYITNVFGSNPQAGDPNTYVEGTKIEAAYLYSVFEDDINVVVNGGDGWRVNGSIMPSTTFPGDPLNFTDKYSTSPTTGDSQFALTNAYTPYILSQQIAPWNGGSPHRYPLFQIWMQGDGTNTNTTCKIEISNVKLAGTVAGSDWGSFSLFVRAFSDTDQKPRYLEQFNNLTLDPTDSNFIARRIGNQFSYIRFDGKIVTYGEFNNNSNYIYIQMSPDPYPTTAVPYGFQAYTTPINGAIGNWCKPISYTMASIYGLFPGKYPSGIDFQGPPPGADSELLSLYPTSSVGVLAFGDNFEYFAPIPSGAGIGTNQIFALDAGYTAIGNGVGTGSFLNPALNGSIPAIYDAANESTYVKMRSFVFGFQGGFDGQSPAITLNIGDDIEPGNTQGLNCVNSTAAGSVAYNQCIGALGNADEFDINLIVTPGILYDQHSYVTNLVVDMCETRQDCFYILDLYKDSGNPATGQIDQVVLDASEFNTSYAGAYYPWIWILDTNINQIVVVPPSVVMPAIYAANDKVAAEWFAAAGLNRGGIPQAVKLTDRTTHLERDVLYEGKVNPIAAFPGQGIVVWGQKTLLNAPDDALNRINVRRLLIAIKKFFASTGRYLVFEQNTAATRNKFLAIANPYLESVQQQSGLYAFQIVMDDNNNTPDLIDQNILYGQIWLQPTKTAEFIIFDFNILPTGAIFPNM